MSVEGLRSFDPLEAKRAGLYPRDVVDRSRAHPPAGLGVNISAQAKRVYCHVFDLAVSNNRAAHPWPGYVYPSNRALAERLGLGGERDVRRYVRELAEIPLLHIERPDRTQGNRYRFLWHPLFGEYPRQDKNDPSEQPADDESPQSMTGQIYPIRQDKIDLSDRTKLTCLYKEEPLYSLYRAEDNTDDTARPSQKAAKIDRLKAALSRWQVKDPGQPPEPPADVLASIFEAGAIHGASVDDISEALDAKWQSYSSGRSAPNAWPWFVSVISTEFRLRKLKGEGLTTEQQLSAGLRMDHTAAVDMADAF